MVKDFRICFIAIFLIAAVMRITGQELISELYKLSKTQFNRGSYDEALKTNIKALQLAEKNGICDEIAYANIMVANMHYYLKDKRLALKNYFTAKQIIDSCGVDSLICRIHHNIGAMYTELAQTDSALLFLNKALKSLNNTQRYADLAKTNSVIADLHLCRTFNLIEAEKYIKEAEKFAQMSGSKHEIIFAKIKRAGLCFRKKEIQSSLHLYKEALAEYEIMGYTEGRLYMLKSIADLLALTGNKESVPYYWKLLVLKDSVFRKETAAKAAEYETVYKTEKKETENKLLQQENLINQSKISSRNKTITGLLIGVVLVIVLVLWRMSILNLRKKKQELESARTLQKEKERISRDLHDNVGGQLSYVLYSLDDFMVEDREKRAELRNNINESVRSVISNLRETIWAVNDEHITLNDISDKLKVYSKNLFRNTPVNIIFSDNLPESSILKSNTGLNLYRICQEILNNAFKYSHAGNIKIIFEKTQNCYSILISDNGKGFNRETIKSGYGLNNIKNRAEESGIKIVCNSQENSGTQYTLIV